METSVAGLLRTFARPICRPAHASSRALPFLLVVLVACGTQQPSPNDTDTGKTAVDSGDSDTGGECIKDTDTGWDTIDSTDSTDSSDTDDSSDSGEPGSCPTEMALVGMLCVDKWEASRPDATASYIGMDTSMATSRAGVIPWIETTRANAQTACVAAGKRLCTADEWQGACQGPDANVYTYGNTYEAATCNSIDSHCACDPPYEDCFTECGGDFGILPTGSMPGCVNEYGLYDMSGNLWEHVDSTDTYAIRGGAYNCGSPASTHQCTYVPGWSPSSVGFRCCREATP
jgi:hypothetical protein